MSSPASIAAQAGRLFALYYGSGVSPYSWNKVGSLRAADITLNGNPVDITTKASNGWREMLPGAGVTQVDFTGSGVWDSGNTYLNQIMQAVISSAGGGAPVYIEAKIQSAAGDSYAGQWVVESFKRSGTHNDAEMFDVTLRSSGPIAYSPAVI